MTLDEKVIEAVDPFAAVVWPHLNDDGRDFVLKGLLRDSAELNGTNWKDILNEILKDEEQEMFYNVLGADKHLQLMYLKSLPQIFDIFSEQPHLMDRLVLSLPSIPRKKGGSIEDRIDIIRSYTKSETPIDLGLVEPDSVIRNALMFEILESGQEAVEALQAKSTDRRFDAIASELLKHYEAANELDYRYADGSLMLNQNFKNEGAFRPKLYQRMDIINYLNNNGWGMFYPTGKGKTTVPIVAQELMWENLRKSNVDYTGRVVVLGPSPVRETWQKHLVGELNLDGTVDHSTRILNRAIRFNFLENRTYTKREIEDLFLDSDYFFLSNGNLRRKVPNGDGTTTSVVEILKDIGYDAFVMDEIEHHKSTVRKKPYSGNALALARQEITPGGPLVSRTVLTPNPLADKVQDICLISAIRNPTKYAESADVLCELRDGGIQKAFYMIRQNGTPLTTRQCIETPPEVKHIIPVKPSGKIYRLMDDILQNGTSVDESWMFQLRYLSTVPHMASDDLFARNNLIKDDLTMVDYPKLEALVDMFTSDDKTVNPLERGEKTVIVSPYFREGVLTSKEGQPTFVDMFEEKLRMKYSDSQRVIKVHGQIPDSRSYTKLGLREKLFSEFTNAADANILFMTTEVGGVSRDLSAANNLICLDPVVAAYIENQIEGRVDRPGQTRPINFYTMMMTDPNPKNTRVRDLTEELDLLDCSYVTYSNAKFVIRSKQATGSIDEATFSLLRLKDIILSYGMFGVLPGQDDLMIALDGKKQTLDIGTTRFSRTGDFDYKQIILSEVLGPGMEKYFELLNDIEGDVFRGMSVSSSGVDVVRESIDSLNAELAGEAVVVEEAKPLVTDSVNVDSSEVVRQTVPLDYDCREYYDLDVLSQAFGRAQEDLRTKLEELENGGLQIYTPENLPMLYLVDHGGFEKLASTLDDKNDDYLSLIHSLSQTLHDDIVSTKVDDDYADGEYEGEGSADYLSDNIGSKVGDSFDKDSDAYDKKKDPFSSCDLVSDSELEDILKSESTSLKGNYCDLGGFEAGGSGEVVEDYAGEMEEDLGVESVDFVFETNRVYEPEVLGPESTHRDDVDTQAEIVYEISADGEGLVSELAVSSAVDDAPIKAKRQKAKADEDGNISDLWGYIFGNEKTDNVDEFIRMRKLDNLGEFVSEMVDKGVTSSVDVAKYIHEEVGGTVYYSDFESMVGSALIEEGAEEAEIRRELMRLYSVTKVASCFENVGMESLEWSALESVYFSLPRIKRVHIFNNSKIYKNEVDFDGFPDEPECLKDGAMSAYDTLSLLPYSYAIFMQKVSNHIFTTFAKAFGGQLDGMKDVLQAIDIGEFAGSFGNSKKQKDLLSRINRMKSDPEKTFMEEVQDIASAEMIKGLYTPSSKANGRGPDCTIIDLPAYIFGGRDTELSSEYLDNRKFAQDPNAMNFVKERKMKGIGKMGSEVFKTYGPDVTYLETWLLASGLANKGTAAAFERDVQHVYLRSQIAKYFPEKVSWDNVMNHFLPVGQDNVAAYLNKMDVDPVGDVISNLQPCPYKSPSVKKLGYSVARKLNFPAAVIIHGIVSGIMEEVLTQG